MRKKKNRRSGKSPLTSLIPGVESTPLADPIGSFEVTENIERGSGNELRRDLLVRFDIPAACGVQRSISMTTKLTDWFEREVRAAMPESPPADLADAIVAQAIVEFQRDLCLFLGVSGLVRLRKVAHAKAVLRFGSDPQLIQSWRGDHFDIQPTPGAFDASADSRKVRAELKREFDKLFDELFPIGRGRAPDMLPVERVMIEEDVRRDFHERKNSQGGSDDEVIRSMAATGRYGSRNDVLGESTIEHIVHPRTPPHE